MKNNKSGLTLVELIVSFVIVGVAVIYFYKTVEVVNGLYIDSRKETSYVVRKNYVARLLHEKAGNISRNNSADGMLSLDGYNIPVKGLTDFECKLYGNGGTIYTKFDLDNDSNTKTIICSYTLDGKTTKLTFSK